MGGFTYPAPRRLDDVVKLGLFKNEDKTKIEAIWSEFYSKKEFNVAETWDAKTFSELTAASKRAGKMFVLPVFKGTGHFVVVSQILEKSIIFTYLDDYRRDPMNAQPYLVVTMYDELLKEKGLVLVRGDVTPVALEKVEGAWLLRMIRRFYLEREGEVASFNKGTFDFEKCFRELKGAYVAEFPTK